MSRWTPKPHGDEPGDRGGARPTNDSSSSGSPDRNDPTYGRLREPRSTDRYVRGRSRMTVRELMEQMNADPDARPGQSVDDSSPTEAIPRITGHRPGRRRAQRGASDHAPRPDEPRSRPRPPEQPGAGEVTRKIPIVGATPEPVVDLSDKATTERVVEESRAQGSHVESTSPAGDKDPAPGSTTAEPTSAPTPTAAAPPPAATPVPGGLGTKRKDSGGNGGGSGSEAGGHEASEAAKAKKVSPGSCDSGPAPAFPDRS